ncbi:hypothetical protein N800_10590 [Lysobacter daejeonensis GH1-9]|uniref:Orotate phosphoribosyltransferase n=1 Tax=Lysobacter daejeonensis GH1-9 TaxID=1385517 RepID=A0A0A0F3T1_9GAMM|nr:DUF4870 domain-containing protein [Lysobacter daejeonensis]KGM56057.1 hypothetical protein N800_10590 [Lysobacter daejeonensis GH1-9]
MTEAYTNPPPVNLTENERLWAAGAHLAALALALLTSWVAGIAGALGALGIWILKRDESAFVAEHAKEAVNFNLSMFIYACAAGLIGFLLVGATILTLGLGIILTAPAGIVLLLAIGAIAVMWLVCSVIATFKAYNGESYRYPLTIRLLK